MTIEEYWKARDQESLSSALTAMRLFGIEVEATELMEAAKAGSGEYSHLSILGATSDLFRALNQRRNHGD